MSTLGGWALAGLVVLITRCKGVSDQLQRLALAMAGERILRKLEHETLDGGGDAFASLRVKLVFHEQLAVERNPESPLLVIEAQIEPRNVP